MTNSSEIKNNVPFVVGFTPLRREDFPLLSSWFATPHCRRWWCDDPAPAAIEKEYGGCVDRREPAQVFIAHCGGRPVGMVQYFRFGDYPEFMDLCGQIAPVPADFCSMDYLIGPPDALGKGIGTAMVAALVARIWEAHPQAPGIIVPVHSDNQASWRTLARLGFVRIAEGELEPDYPGDSRAHCLYRVDRPGQA